MRYGFHILSLLLALSACNKPTGDPEIVYLDPSIDDYVLFPVGSWWVYEEETTGEKDTLTVVDLFRTIPPSDSDIGPYERASLDVESTFYGSTHDYSCSSFKKGSNVIFYGAGAGHEGGGGNIMFKTGMYHGEERGSDFYSRYTYYEYDSLKIGDIFYYDIKSIQNSHDVPAGPECIENFVNAYGIGVVQRETCEGLTWNLIDYFINE